MTSAGVRPVPLEEGRPQGKVKRHAGIGYEIVQNLDVPVPQMVEQLPNIVQFLASYLLVVSEQVIDVPKIFVERHPPQKAEKLVEVPTIVSFSSLQRIVEHTVDIPVPGHGGRNSGLHQNRVRQRLVPSRSLTSLLVEVSKVSSMDWVRGVRTRSLPFPLLVQAFRIFSQERVLLFFARSSSCSFSL